MAHDPRIRTAFWVSLRWMLIGLILLIISVLILLIGPANNVKISIGVIGTLAGVFCFIQSYRTIKLFYRGAVLITAGVGLIYITPVLQHYLLSVVLLIAKALAGPESAAVVNYIQPALELFHSFSDIPGRLSGADYFCGIIGLALCTLGVIAGRDGTLRVSASNETDISSRARFKRNR